jgi:hypothetical protein
MDPVTASQFDYLSNAHILNWVHNKTFVVDDDGFALLSSQKIHPHFPSITMYFYFKKKGVIRLP